jgi:hypothetical protein
MKIVNSLREKTPKKENVCSICSSLFLGRTKYCSPICYKQSVRVSVVGYDRYKADCRFMFPLHNYPNEFDFSLIEKYGWYKAKNRGDNANGVSRDHIISVKWGFENNVGPKYISHPANCQLMRQCENSSKGKKKSISVEELKEKIKNWDLKYLI